MSSSIEPELVASIVATPEEDGPRLVYADWLSDRGDPRGELIAVQCALAAADRDEQPVEKTNPLRDQSMALLTTHRARWLEPVLDIAVGNYQFRRGFIEVIDVLHPDIDAARLREACPLLRAIKTPRATVNDVFRCIDVIPVDELTIYKITDTLMLHRVTEQPRLERLRRLDLHYESGPLHLNELTRLHFPLHRLALRFDRTQPFDEPALLASLTAHPARAMLRSLDLAHTRAEELGVLERLPELEALALTRCAPAMPALSRLALPRLTSLAITDEALETLDPASLVAAFPALRRLRLSNARLGDRAARSLAASPHATRLRRLDLSNNQISGAGALALAESEHLQDLVWLDLTGNPAAAAARDRVGQALAHAEVRW
jgi:uncharacterized protein (TIGR02996 family)